MVISDLNELKKIQKIRGDYADSLRVYEEYKKIRIGLGRSPRAFNDRDAILKDLLGEGFSVLEKEIERAKKTTKQTRSRPNINRRYY